METAKRHPAIANPRVDVTINRGGDTWAVTLSANNEFSRIARLGNVALRLSSHTLAKIAELRDHKGLLGVEWQVLPNGGDIAAVHAAWAAEGECITDHFYNRRSLLANDCDEPPSAFGGNTLNDESNVVEFPREKA
jgi:hypothetical protein